MTRAENRRYASILAKTEQGGEALPASLEETTRLDRMYFEAARASAYVSDLRDFATWCKVEAGGDGYLRPIDQIVYTLCNWDEN